MSVFEVDEDVALGFAVRWYLAPAQLLVRRFTAQSWPINHKFSEEDRLCVPARDSFAKSSPVVERSATRSVGQNDIRPPTSHCSKVTQRRCKQPQTRDGAGQPQFSFTQP